MFRILAIALVVFLGSCSAVRVSTVTEDENIHLTATEKFGERYTIFANESESYFIVLQKTKKLTDLFPDIHFFIFEQETQTVVFDDVLKQGSIQWISDKEISTISILEERDKDGLRIKDVYTYNVYTKNKNNN